MCYQDIPVSSDDENYSVYRRSWILSWNVFLFFSFFNCDIHGGGDGDKLGTCCLLSFAQVA